MVKALQHSTNPTDPILSRFALTPANALVWTAKNTEHIIVPPSHCAALLKEAHDPVISSHQGIEEMYSALAEVYSSYWPAMYKDVHAYCVTCDSCATNKPRNHSPSCHAQPVPVPELPWTAVGIDFVGPLPMS
eukprot:580200-Rhodomonas_salina.1